MRPRGSSAHWIFLSDFVSLGPDSPRGPITEHLKFAPVGDARSMQADVLSRLSLLVVTDAVGGARARTRAVAFGAIAAGRVSAAELEVQGESEHALDDIKLSSDQPWLGAKPVGPVRQGSKAPASREPCVVRTVQVTIGPGAPHGAIGGRLRIALASGEYLLIPVTAFVGDY